MPTLYNRKKDSIGGMIFNILNILMMLALMIISLYPLLYVLFSSFSDPMALSRFSGLMLHPMGFSLRGYKALFAMKTFWLNYRNTLFYIVAGTAINMTLTVLGAYVLSFKGYLLRVPFTLLVVFTMYFNGGMIPTFLVVRQLGITDTVLGFLIPGCVSVYNMIVLRTSFKGIPSSLMESASIDGANHILILIKIVLPLSKAALATITLFYAVGRWGEWYNAMVYLTNRADLYPLQMFLRQLIIQESNLDNMSEGVDYYLLKAVIKYAAVISATLPILVVYPFLQKYFVKGVMVGSIKE